MNLTSSDNPYIQDLLRQPQALSETLRAFPAADLDPLRELGGRLGGGELAGAVLTGMGSSFHALHPLLLTLISAGVQAQMVETSELIHHAPGLLAADRLVVAVSQSGRSAEMLGLLERTRGRVPLVGVTNTPGSPLASGSDACLLTRAGDEFSVSCKTYVTALVALALLGRLLTGQEPGALLSGLEGLPGAVEGYLSRLDRFVLEFQARLKGIRNLYLTGRGASLAAVGTGGLIIKESAHFPAEGMSAAAFRHGPLELVSAETFVLVYAGLEPTVSFNRSLAADVEKAGGRSDLVACDEGEGVFHLPEVPAAALPVLEILPAQVASLALARLQGHVPGRFIRATKVTSVE